MGSYDRAFAKGHNHDRVHDEFSTLPPALPAGTDDGVDPATEITAVQRMLSATSGSLLTGLLGKDCMLVL
jgi:solute carrier family 25, member 39/40